MPQFFIDRPIFAWVVALFIIVAGAVSVTQLPIAQYPTIAPPTIVLTATYPGASAQTMNDTVLSVIETQLNGAQGMVYMESVSQANGTGTITVSFDPSINPDMAQVDVQNRLSRATPRLPAAVNQIGVTVDKARSNTLLFVMLSSTDPGTTFTDLNDYAVRNIQPELLRVPGIGQVTVFGAERAVRIWIDPAKLQSYNLSTTDVHNAIAQQNAQVAGGTLGDMPQTQGQSIYATILVPGQLDKAEQFGAIVLRANADGSSVRLRDVARVEIGAQSYSSDSRLNGKTGAGMAVQLSPSGGNALEASKMIHQKMEQLQQYFPAGMSWTIPYDSSEFVAISIEEVVKTLLIAVALVFAVMYLFLQDWRYTVIPTIVVPVTLLGTFAALMALGMSINVLTMFGMVLVIGIVVDDAIVVVENVERIMSEEGLPPLQAARKAMGQITGAIVGVTVVLISVFVPLAFFKGSIGNIYRQFSAVMVVSIFCSAFMALSLTPALCATLLKPVQAGHHHEKGGFFGWFNRTFHSGAKGYESWVAKLLRRAGRLMIIYVVIIGAVVALYQRLPTAFLPQEDQGTLIAMIQLPPGASLERTHQVVEQYEQYMRAQPEVQNVVAVAGYSPSGQGQNMGFSFVALKPWDQRKGAEHSSDAIAKRALVALSSIKDAFIYPLPPPAVPELGLTMGFDLRLQDRGGKGHDALLAARNQLLGMAMKNPALTNIRPDGLEDAGQLQIDIDRDKAASQGVSFGEINSVISAALGSDYVNDFPSKGRMQRVVVQADAPARMQIADILKITVKNEQGQAVPLSAFASTRWVTGQMQSIRYNGYPAMRIKGEPAPGHSSGEAMKLMEQYAAQLPEGFGYEWTGISREEKLGGNQALYLYAFAILAVVLALAALYESWSIPLAVILVVPLGVLGVLTAVSGRQLSNDVYFQVGLITIIGLSAKNAILIIEFAKDLQAQGMSALEAALGAAHLRFRPIVMTSLAFLLGVLPLAIASGAGSAGQRDIGTGVMGGIIIGTSLAVFFVPMFFVVVRRFFKGSARERERFAEHAAHAGITPQAAQEYLHEAEANLSDDERRALHQGTEPSAHGQTPREPQ
jgi:multidrug efflux pump